MNAPQVDWRHVGEVRWESGGDGPAPDVANLLRQLRFGELDDVSEALTDLLYSYAWCQGVVYPVAAQLIPYVFDIVDNSPILADNFSERLDAATFIPLVASAARTRPSPAGQAVLRVLSGCGPSLEGWLSGDFPFEAALAMLHVPQLRPLVFEEEQRQQMFEAILWRADLADGEAREWAALELESSVWSGHPVCREAARMLRSAVPPDSFDHEKLFALASALAEGSPGALDELRGRFRVSS